jgi:tight adherence protein C
MLPLLSAVALGAAILFAALALRARSAPSFAALRLAALRDTKPTPSLEEQAVLEPPERSLRGRLSAPALKLLPGFLLRGTSERLVAAGSPATTAEFVGVSLVVGASAGTFVGALVLAYGGSVANAVMGALVVTLVSGLFLPAMWLRRRVRVRRTEIWRSLPDAADLLTTCVEAGLDINASFARVALEMEGSLRDEVQRMLREVSLGRRRRDALTDIAERTGVEDLGGMLNAIVQAEESGTSLGLVLRAQSDHIRATRRLFAEERARMVPAKMTFPIVFFIVPTLFILIMGPLGIELMETFG